MVVSFGFLFSLPFLFLFSLSFLRGFRFCFRFLFLRLLPCSFLFALSFLSFFIAIFAFGLSLRVLPPVLRVSFCFYAILRLAVASNSTFD